MSTDHCIDPLALPRKSQKINQLRAGAAARVVGMPDASSPLVMQAAAKLAAIEAATEETLEITLLDLVAAVADHARDESEVVAAVADLINSGKVTLVGNFRGADVRIG